DERQAEHRGPGPEARDDPGIRREQPGGSGHRVQAGPNVVTQIRSQETDGYVAVQLAFGAVDPRRVNKPETGHFSKAGVTPRRYLVELRTTDAGEYQVGQEITAEVFPSGSVVDVTGTSKGKGTAGVMKRHGFSGLSAS